MSFASRLKQARENAGFTQQELAKALGVTKSAIGNYENGVSSPKWDVLLKIFDILHVEPNFLYQDSFDLTKKYPVTLTPKQADLIAFFNLLNAAGQNKVIDYAKDLVSTGHYNLTEYSADEKAVIDSFRAAYKEALENGTNKVPSKGAKDAGWSVHTYSHPSTDGFPTLTFLIDNQPEPTSEAASSIKTKTKTK